MRRINEQELNHVRKMLERGIVQNEGTGLLEFYRLPEHNIV